MGCIEWIAKATSRLFITARPISASPDPRARRSSRVHRPRNSRRPLATRGAGAGAGRACGRWVGAGTASPTSPFGRQPRPRPGPPSRGLPARARSRVAAAADGHWPMVHLQADGTAELSLQTAVTARGPSRWLPLLRGGHQAAEHRHARAGRRHRRRHRRRPLSRPADWRHCRDGAALASPLSPRIASLQRPLVVTSSRRAGSPLLQSVPAPPCVRPVRITRDRRSGSLRPCRGRGKSFSPPCRGQFPSALAATDQSSRELELNLAPGE